MFVVIITVAYICCNIDFIPYAIKDTINSCIWFPFFSWVAMIKITNAHEKYKSIRGEDIPVRNRHETETFEFF